MGDEYVCPNGHPVLRIRVVNCARCRASVIYEPQARGMAYERTLQLVQLYAEKMRRDDDATVRTSGEDLLEILQSGD